VRLSLRVDRFRCKAQLIRCYRNVLHMGSRDGERDHPRVGGRRLDRECRGRCLGVGAAAEQGGGDGVDGQGAHDQHGVPGDRGVEPDLGLVEPEAVLRVGDRLRGFDRLPGARLPGSWSCSQAQTTRRHGGMSCLSGSRRRCWRQSQRAPEPLRLGVSVGTYGAQDAPAAPARHGRERTGLLTAG
jgi:hypothetical protein